MAKWIKTTTSDSTVFVLTEDINGARTKADGTVEVHRRGDPADEWRVAHSTSENVLEFQKLMAALDLWDAA